MGRCASDIHSDGDDGCLGARCIVGGPRLPAAAPGLEVCERHGEVLEDGECWECSMEADIQAQDRADAERAAAMDEDPFDTWAEARGER